jgi:hypothetical protein
MACCCPSGSAQGYKVTLANIQNKSDPLSCPDCIRLNGHTLVFDVFGPPYICQWLSPVVTEGCASVFLWMALNYGKVQLAVNVIGPGNYTADIEDCSKPFTLTGSSGDPTCDVLLAEIMSTNRQ